MFANCWIEAGFFTLISKMGVTRAKSGPFGLGGDAALLENEKTIRQLAAQRGVDMSVVRVGILKGGGPGETQAEGEAVSGVEVGLAKPYYDGLLDLCAATTPADPSTPSVPPPLWRASHLHMLPSLRPCL